MRAGNLDRLIEIQRRTTGLDLYGTVTDTWTTYATMRAQLLKNATDDREGASGHTTDAVLTFRSYYFASLSLNDRLLYEGQPYEIKGITEIGRRVGIDVVCERIGLSV
ncbi:phage head closure protein [Bradyrhizobium sp. Bra64]|uniref:phage head closure protein n=1 Tax=Bradyrhizobium sp. Bra64 TaxID=2926009 RepID=UPI002119649D